MIAGGLVFEGWQQGRVRIWFSGELGQQFGRGDEISINFGSNRGVECSSDGVFQDMVGCFPAAWR